MNRIVPSVSLILTLACFVVRDAPAQTPLHSLSGSATDVVTGQPLEHVDVFLGSTLLGTSTDTRGNFRLDSIPPGRYELVASRVGYERFVRTIEIPFDPGTQLQLSLTARVLTTGRVDIIAPSPEEWKYRLDWFTVELLGRTPNAHDCRILNPEVMSLESPAVRTLIARTDEPLKVENRALGYRVTLHLTEFSLDRQGLKSAWNIRFEELEPEDEDEADEWREARMDAYEGSYRHFFRSIARRQSEDTGFDLSLVPGMRPSSRQRGTVVSESDILWDAGPDGSKKQLRFHDYLEVRYRGSVRSISWIELHTNGIQLSSRGDVLNPLDMTVYGSWSAQRLADAVPLELGMSEFDQPRVPTVVSHSSLGGVVLDELTREPVPLVNVVVRGTRIGATTDSAGRFFIDELPGDSAAVSFSHIAYEALLVPLHNDPPKAHETTFLLTQSLVRLPEVVVEGTLAFAERTPSYLIGHDELEALGEDDMEYAMRYLLTELVRPLDVRMRFPSQDFTLYIDDEWRESIFLDSVDPYTVRKVAVWAPWTAGDNSQMEVSYTTPIRYPLRRGRFVMAVWTDGYRRGDR